MIEAVRSDRGVVPRRPAFPGLSVRAVNRGQRACVIVAVWLLAFAMPLQASEVSDSVDLRATRAPLASALEHLAGLDGREVKVSDDIRDQLSGRLAGRAEELVALLVDTHDLSVYRDVDTVWFDRQGRRVVDFVRLDPAQIEPALDALARPPGVGGAALRDAAGKGIVLSGTRRYVETSLRRVLLATGSERSESATLGSGAPVATPSGGTAPAAAAPVPEETDEVARFEDKPVTIRLSLDEPRADAVLGARIAMVSSRSPRSVVLADGSRLALGESLPNGHRIVAIERERIVTERDDGLTIVAVPE